MTYRRLSKHAGLSLLELLIALALLAMIAAGLAGSLSLGVRLHDRTDQLAANADEITIRLRLRRWLSTALPPTRLTTFSNLFEANSRRLVFTSIDETPWLPEAAALRVTVTREGEELILIAEPLDDNGAVLDTLRAILVRAIEDVRISYYSAEENASGWIAEWKDPTRLPELVRITIEPKNTEPIWPEFTVAPALGR